MKDVKVQNKQTVSIIGAGRLGGALAIALARNGYKIENLTARSFESSERIANLIKPAPRIFTAEQISQMPFAEIVLITTPDPEIEPTAALLAENSNFKSEIIFLHTSGSLSSEVLRKLKEKGANVGSLHPLVSVSESIAGAERFAVAFFCVEGDEGAVNVSKKIVADLGGKAFSIETEFKTLYHAAAVMTAGHLVALFDVAAGMLADCGLEKAEAAKILLPLARSTVENLEKQTPASALTGTFSRADVETMQKHLSALQTNEAALRVYLELGKHSIELAREQGADAEKLKEMQRILSQINSSHLA